LQWSFRELPQDLDYNFAFPWIDWSRYIVFKTIDYQMIE
jgi:hypothetical protein